MSKLPSTKQQVHNNLNRTIRSFLDNKPYCQDQLDHDIKEFDCNRYQLMEYIKSKFREGMSWDNYGSGFQLDDHGRPMYDKSGNIIYLKQWVVDHIRPLADYVKKGDSLSTANYYTNLQPLWWRENRSKCAKLKWSPSDYNKRNDHKDL